MSPDLSLAESAVTRVDIAAKYGSDDLDVICKYMSNTYIQTALAAVEQGNTPIVIPQLNKSKYWSALSQNNDSKLSISVNNNRKLASPVLSMSQVRLVFNYNRINMKVSPYDKIIDLFNKSNDLLMIKEKSIVPAINTQSFDFDSSLNSGGSSLPSNSSNRMVTASFGSEYFPDKSILLYAQLYILRARILADMAYDLLGSYHSSYAVQSYDYLKKSIKLIERVERNKTVYESKAYGAFCEISDKILQNEKASVENDESDSNRNKKGKTDKKKADVSSNRLINPIDLIKSYLKGIQLGNKFCINRIMRLVTIFGENAASIDINDVTLWIDSIPAWIFIKYSSQFMGCLDLPQGKLCILFLEKVAKKYPNAIYYSYNITKEFFG